MTAVWDSPGGLLRALAGGMPRYRITKPLPEALEYRGGVRLLLHRYSSTWGTEILAYRKDQLAPYSAVILCRGQGNPSLDEQLDHGFDVPAGGVEEHLMRSLVAKGYAEALA